MNITTDFLQLIYTIPSFLALVHYYGIVQQTLPYALQQKEMSYYFS